MSSAWYEANGILIDAFHHAAAATDIQRAARLMEGEKLPVHHRSVATPILTWLDSLLKTALDAQPSLWIERVRMLLALGQTRCPQPYSGCRTVPGSRNSAGPIA